MKKISQLYRPVLMMTINYRFDAFAAIRPLLLNNVEKFAEGFGCEAFQNTAGARIEAERPNAAQNFWWMGSWKVGWRSNSLLKNCVQRRSSILLNGYVNKQNCRFWTEDQPEALHPENVTGLVVSLDLTPSKMLWIVLWYPTFFDQNTRAWLAWHVVSARQCHIPHSTRNDGFIKRWPVNWPSRS